MKLLTTIALVILGLPALIQAQKLAWSATEPGQIWTSGLDGSNPQLLLDIGLQTGLPGHEPRKLAYASGQLYWTENTLGEEGIWRADVNGNNVTRIVDMDASFGSQDYWPEGLTTLGDNVYWADTFRKQIYRAGTDGNNPTVLVDGTDGTLNDATGVTTDGSFIYWVDGGFNGIYRANLDGSNVMQLVDLFAFIGDGFSGEWDITHADGKLYWTAVFDTDIYSVNVDGSNPELVLDTLPIGATRPFGISEFDDTLFFGNSDNSGIYSVNTDGTGGTFLAKPTTDDRYPVVIPEPAAISWLIGMALLLGIARRRNATRD